MAAIIQEIVTNMTLQDFIPQFHQHLLEYSCITPNGFLYPTNNEVSSTPGVPWTKETCNALKGYCTGEDCSLDRHRTCAQRCFGDLPWRDGFCIFNFTDFSTYKLSRPNICQILLETDSDSLCYLRGGNYSYTWPTFRQFGSCIKSFGPDVGPDQCYTKQCIHNLTGDGFFCRSYCYIDPITSYLCQGSITGDVGNKVQPYLRMDNGPY
eukprot:TRINITY_DN3522_c0_g5_i1.p1 TRINITY_DN3522_c0_g5~~TRINITY_DN3522_c0_g5_i1.p1  ORF type:complete len:209 (-),score=14.05 TRINITY_DN3522_c0_g5_i1:140-766(-)